MGFWQNLAESYDKNIEALKLLYPLSATSISNNGDFIAVIVIDENGKFIEAKTIDKPRKDKSGNYVVSPVQICIPVTERSMGRSGSLIAPHPVFDQYEYLKGEGKKYDEYFSQLKGFAESTFSTAQVKAIYKYFSNRKVAVDLQKISPKDKTFVIFEVTIPGKLQTKVWEDPEVFGAWHKYYMSAKTSRAKNKVLAEKGLASKNKLSAEEKKKLLEWAKLEETISMDYITGFIEPVATSHPKKIFNEVANSKLVSANDKTNFTFRGKFSDSSEAVSISYEATQKAHQFLRYLVNDRSRSHYCGEQVIVTFTIDSTEELISPLDDTKSIWSFLQAAQIRTEKDIQISLKANTGMDYAAALKKAIDGFGYSKSLEKHEKSAVVALDAATTGRLSITFYRELDKCEYLESIAEWHDSCKWRQRFWDIDNQRYVYFIGAPSVDKIIESVYGKPRGSRDESYIKIKKNARERLLRCIFDRGILPRDYLTSAIRRASNPLGVTTNGKFDRGGFEQLLATACALVRKYQQQFHKEEYNLSIELERTDRDYLYGRLLGAADKLEEYALFKKDKDRLVTAAIRHMQAFAQRPFRTWQTIHSCLNPYIQTVKGGFAFNEIQQIQSKFASVSDYSNDKPLNGLYLIGYYHERAYIDSLVELASAKKTSTYENAKGE